MLASMERQDFVHEAPDGTNIQVYRWLCDDPKAIVHISHGMAEHAQRYAFLADALTATGFSVYAHDHRGHGQSIPPGEQPGHLGDDDGWQLLVDDVHAINRSIAAQHPGLPIIALGHSMGSFAVQQLLYEKPNDYAGAIMSASNGKPPPIAIAGRIVARVESRRVGKRSPSPLIQKLTFEDFNKRFAPNRTTADWLSRDTEQVDKYVADPLCGFACTTQTWVSFLRALPKIASPTNTGRVKRELPILIIAGNEDPVGDRGAGVLRLGQAYRDAGMSRVDLKLYDGARHEILNETNRDEVVNDILEWCDKVVTGARDRL